MKSEDAKSFLGKESEFEGNLKFRGAVRIDGILNGQISAAEGDLVVGEEGNIHADIEISSISISGEVEGNIVAGHKVEICPSGRVVGKIRTQSLVLQEGGFFEGDILMHEDIAEGGNKQRDAAVIDLKDRITDKLLPRGRIHGFVLAEPHRPSGFLEDILLAKMDMDKGEPIENARIYAKCKGIGKRKIKTDRLGHYEFKGLEDGKWELTLKVRGYDEVKATVEILDGGEYRQDF